MIQVEMSKDIKDFSPKVISIFDKRQLASLALSCVYGVPFMLYATSIPFEHRFVIAFVLMLPVAACGWVKMYDMPLEMFIRHIIKTNIMTPSKRIYKTDNTFGYIDPDPPDPKDVTSVKEPRLTWRARRKRKKALIKFGAVK